METLGSELQNIVSRFKALVSNRQTLSKLSDMLAQNIEKEKVIMSKITDWAAAEQADLTTISTTLDAVVSGVAALDALIVAFQNSPGTLSPSDQAALDGIQAASKALVAKSAAISVTPPPPPPPPPGA